MKPSKETIIKKHINGNNDHCAICGKQIYKNEIEKNEIEYSKSKRGIWTFFHKKCFINSINLTNTTERPEESLLSHIMVPVVETEDKETD